MATRANPTLAWFVAVAVLVAGSALVWWATREGEATTAARASAGIARRAESNPNETPIATAAAPASRESTSPLQPARRETPSVALRIAGECVDSDGRPLSDVEITRSPGPGGEAPIRSDGVGRFVVAAPAPPGTEPWTIELAFRKVGFARRSLKTAAASDRETQLGKVVLLPGAAVRGRVVDAAGKGVAKARIEFTVPGERGYLGLTSDAEGNFLWDSAPCGAVTLRARTDDGGESEAVGLTLAPGVDAEALLKIEGDDEETILGIVLTPDGAPSPGAIVSATFKSKNRSSTSGFAADAEGRFRFRPRDKGNYSFQVSDKNQEFGAVTVQNVAPGTRNLQVRLVVARRFEIRVVDERGRPVERYGTRVLDAVGMARFGLRSEEVHKDGVESLLLPPERFSVLVDATGFEKQTVGPFTPATAPTSIDVRLVPVPGVRGIVLSDRKPVGGARVRAVRAIPANTNYERNGYRSIAHSDVLSSTATALDGTFVLPIRDDGNYYVRAESEGFAEAEVGPIWVVGREGASGLELRLGPGGTLQGRVVGAPGESTAGVIVGISRGDGAPKTQRVDSEGNYRFTRLTPGGYQVRRAEKESVSGGGSSTMETTGGEVPPIPWDCTVEEGKVTTYDLYLGSVKQVDITVTLRINGAIPAGFSGMLARGSGGGWTSDNDATVDGEGRLHMRAAKPGPYLVVLQRGRDRARSDSDDITVSIEAVAGENPIDVEFATGRIEGTVANPNEQDDRVELRLGNEKMQITQRVTIAKDGTFVFPAAPVGKCALLRIPRTLKPATVEVTAGQTAKAEVP